MDAHISPAKSGIFRILKIHGNPSLVQRLADIGFYDGAVMELLYRAPLSGPYIIKVGPSIFALRPDELDCLTLEKLS